MDEYENLVSKSDADLRAITVAFGDFTPEEAESKTREELIDVILGKQAPAKTSKTKSTKTRSTKTSAKKSAKTETEVKEEKTEESAEKAEESPKKKTRKTKKTETSESAPEAVPEEKSEAPEVKEVKEEKKAKKTTKASSSKTSKKTKEESAAETPAEEKTGKKTKKTASKKKEPASETEVKEEVKEEVKAEVKAEAKEEVKESKPENKPKETGKKRSAKRSFSFGDSGVKEIEVVPETAPASENENQAPVNNEPEVVYTEIEGVLSFGGQESKDYCGFVHKTNYLPGEGDAYVSGQMIKRMGLRKGDYIKGLVAPARPKDKYAPLKKVLAVNGVDVSESDDYEVTRKRPRFESLTAIYPDERLTLETNKEDLSCRIIDLFSPIGKGQRGMIVSPPKAGKTILLKKVANSITDNNPKCKLIVLLIDERPEEVTDMQRSIKGEVVYSTFDKKPENHVKVTELVLERAMRLVEMGEDVVILLDSMTRLARAYNLTINPTGRTLSGGLDPGSLYGPKRFFGAARNIENGGSLTIISTALIETGSRMDEVIFEEFKGTGNMEVTLDRKLADRRIYPAIAVDKSGTRREDLLLSKEELEAVWLVRKAIADADTIAATNAVLNLMNKTLSNMSFVQSVKKSLQTD